MKLKLSPGQWLYVYSKHDNCWYLWSPNGEWFESDDGDELTDDQVSEWPEATLGE